MMETEISALKAQLEEKRRELSRVGYRYLNMPHQEGPGEPEAILAQRLERLEHTRKFVCNDGWGWRRRQRQRMAKARERVKEAERLVADDTPEKKASREERRAAAGAANKESWDNFILTSDLERQIKAIEVQIQRIEKQDDNEPPEPPSGGTDGKGFELAAAAVPHL